MGVSTRALITTTAILLAVTACKTAPPPPPPEAQQPTPPAAPPTLAVAGIELGRAIAPDKKVAAPLATFGLRDTIYASVATTGAAAGVLTAKWTFQTGQVVDSTAVSVAPTGPAQTEFHIVKKSAWPAGKYKVAILLDGQPASEKDFEIKK